MGGQLPRTLEVRNPRMNVKVKIDIPMGDNDQTYRVFSRNNVIGLCMDSLRTVGDWNYVVEREMMEGKALELTWRSDTNLDWIWLEDDIYGNPRASAVLCGLALKQVRILLFYFFHDVLRCLNRRRGLLCLKFVLQSIIQCTFI
jgi:hypothetical protein